MGIIVILILVSLSIAILFLLIFFWNIRSGQYDDTYTPSVRMLFEDKRNDETPSEQKTTTASANKSKGTK